MSRSAPPIIRLARLVAGEAAPKGAREGGFRARDLRSPPPLTLVFVSFRAAAAKNPGSFFPSPAGKVGRNLFHQLGNVAPRARLKILTPLFRSASCFLVSF